MTCIVVLSKSGDADADTRATTPSLGPREQALLAEMPHRADASVVHPALWFSHLERTSRLGTSKLEAETAPMKLPLLLESIVEEMMPLLLESIVEDMPLLLESMVEEIRPLLRESTVEESSGCERAWSHGTVRGRPVVKRVRKTVRFEDPEKEVKSPVVRSSPPFRAQDAGRTAACAPPSARGEHQASSSAPSSTCKLTQNCSVLRSPVLQRLLSEHRSSVVTPCRRTAPGTPPLSRIFPGQSPPQSSESTQIPWRRRGDTAGERLRLTNLVLRSNV